MGAVEDFLADVDRQWQGSETHVPLRLIGSTALLLRTDYQRITDDSDVLQTTEVTDDIKRRLLELAGKKSTLHARHGMYVQVLSTGFPLLAHQPLFHPMAQLNATLQHFEIHALDVVDVVVAKLAPFRQRDRDDIRQMIVRGLVPHDRLVARFKDAVDEYSGGAGAEDIPKFWKNLNQVERDFLEVDETEMELPDWLADRV